MNIIYQHRSLADGAEGVHITEVAAAFRSLGHEVVMSALADATEPEGRRTRFLARVKAHLPRPVRELLMLALNLGEYVAFRRALQKHRPAFVYKRHSIYDFGVVLAAKHLGVPLVLEVNCPYASPNCQRFEPSSFPFLVRLCERRATTDASLVLTVSTPLKTLLETVNPKASGAIVVPNGASPSRFNACDARREEIRARYGLGSSVVVGWAGILREWHRVELLLGAVARAPALQLLIIGDGPDRSRLEGMLAGLDLIGRVHFTGRIPHEEMAAYIAAVDIAAVADDRTGFASPMKMLEYMAMGRAVVAPRLRNIEDIVDHERDGVLFRRGDANDLAAVLARLAADPEWRASLGRQARLKIERERNWRRNADIVLKALADRLDRPPVSAKSAAATAIAGTGKGR